jgi:hypothetical protein
MSVSKIECIASLRGKGDIKLSLFRHLAPATVNLILREMPIKSRVTIYPNAMLCMLTRIRAGVEKQRFEYKRGEVAFLAATGSLCFFLRNVKSEKPLNPLGKVEENLEILEQASAGDVLELKLVQEASDHT